MIKFALIPLILLSLTVANGQISVSQGFVDDATKAFIELRAERAVTKAQEAEISAKNDLIRTQSLLIESLKQGIEARDKQVEALAALKCDTSQVKLFFVIKFTKKSCR